MTFSEDPNTSSSAEEHHASTPYQSAGERLSRSSSHALLRIAISTAVPLWVYEIYQRGGPTPDDWERLPSLGHLIAEQGDYLLYRSPREGETAALFNTLAEALALLSFVPGGVPFGEQRFDALQILTGFLGADTAKQYLTSLRRPSAQEREGA